MTYSIYDCVSDEPKYTNLTKDEAETRIKTLGPGYIIEEEKKPQGELF